MNKPTLYDFWAPWCGPCRAMAPTIDSLAEKLKDKLDVVKVNVDEQPQLAEQYGIRSIPTLVLMDTEEKLRIVGAKPAATLELELQKALGG